MVLQVASRRYYYTLYTYCIFCIMFANHCTNNVTHTKMLIIYVVCCDLYIPQIKASIEILIRHVAWCIYMYQESFLGKIWKKWTYLDGCSQYVFIFLELYLHCSLTVDTFRRDQKKSNWICEPQIFFQTQKFQKVCSEAIDYL